jgi:serine O-acetyltransferase
MAIEQRSVPRRHYLTLADRLLGARDGRGAASQPGALPSSADIADLADDLLAVCFPEASRGGPARHEVMRERLAATLAALERRLEAAVYLGKHRRCGHVEEDAGCRTSARATTGRLLAALPQIRSTLLGDVRAALEGDPAATGPDEVIACYPGLYAIAIYRVAHKLLELGVPLIPRMLTEHAKARTGIDIHPGARIGPSFFIDHGTGIVIGETTDIGRSVRIYQGVTLGALSIKREALATGKRAGKKRPGARADKRHPTIEDDVIIYASATILGGETVIGRGAVIGGNTFITYSIPPGTRVGVGR